MCFFSPQIEVLGAHYLHQVLVISLLLLFNAFMLFENAMLMYLSVCSRLLFMYFVLTFVFLWLVSCFLCLLVCLFVCLFVPVCLFVGCFAKLLCHRILTAVLLYVADKNGGRRE